jgi:hypothetical protein
MTALGGDGRPGYHGGMDFRKHMTLIIGIAIPILMIVFVALSIYLPALFASPPTFNFLYTTSETYRYASEYTVSNGKLTRIPRRIATTESYVTGDPLFYLFDVAKGESTELTFAEASKLMLDPNPVSPDGYEVVQGRGHGGFLFSDFDGDDYRSFYLRGHNVSRKIALNLGQNSYWNFRFLGWVSP